jgi:hypothetical protein
MLEVRHMYLPCRCCIANCPFIRNEHTTTQDYSYMRNLARPNSIIVTTKETKYENPNIQVDLKIPEIHGISNINVEKSINNSILSDVMEFKNEMELAAKENADKATADGKKFIPYRISAIYELTYNKNNIISISMVYHEYVNGLNRYIKVPYNFDVVTGKSLSLKDLFIPGVDYRSLINKEIRAQLIRNKEKYFPETIEKFKGIAEDQPFYLQNEYLVIFFGFNEIAPIEAEIPVFKIPLSHFPNSIKPILLRNASQ